MQRLYLQNLQKWINSPNRKPLLIYGARQIGKTYLIKQLFAKDYFKDRFIYIDLRKDNLANDFCSKHVDSNEIINFLQNYKHLKIDKNTLIIFDEAQSCLPIITAMKYFCQDHPEIPLIVTGSLVRIKIQRELHKPGPKVDNKILFPLGKINTLYMYQLNFEEFLINKDINLYNTICEAYKNKVPLMSGIHELALKCFHGYLMVGGMPEAVKTYLETNSYDAASDVIKELYDNYLGDMGSYQTSIESTNRTKAIYSSIYSQLNKEQKNFSSSLIQDNLRHRDLLGPIDWLVQANVVLKSKQLKQRVTLPLIAPNDSLYRLYLSDMGIFTHQSNNNIASLQLNNSLSGIYYENYVAIELNRIGLPLFYWKGKARGEFEFLIQHDNCATPIDVKKSRGSLTSLPEFRSLNKSNLAIKVSSNNYGFDKEKGILTIPFYMFFLFAKSIADSK